MSHEASLVAGVDGDLHVGLGQGEKHFSKWIPQIHEPGETITNVCYVSAMLLALDQLLGIQ